MLNKATTLGLSATVLCALASDAGAQPSTPLPLQAQEVSVAVIGGEEGHDAAAQAFMAGDLAGTIERIDASTYNSMTVEDLRLVYDVLIFAWGADAGLHADWETRILPFLRSGGGILFEVCSGNVGDLAPGVIGTQVNSTGDVRVTATVPGLTDGVGNDPGGFVDWHMAFAAWDPALHPFLVANGLTIGLYGEFEGGRIVLTGTDQEFHAQFGAAGAQGNQYRLLVNEIRWVARLYEESACLSATCEVDYFKCYRARRAPAKLGDVEPAGATETNEPTGVGEVPSISVLDQFGVRDVALVRPFSVCNAVSKDGVEMKDSGANLLCYRTKRRRDDPRQNSAKLRPGVVEVQNEFGSQSVKLTSGNLLCVPARSIDADVAPTSTSPFQCYKSRGGSSQSIPVILRDRFGTTLARVSKPTTACSNATLDKDAIEVPQGPGLHCRRITRDKGQVKLVPRTVEVVGPFGIEALRVTRPHTLCVPSSLRAAR